MNEFDTLKKLTNSYQDESRRVFQGRVGEWGVWDFTLKLPGFTEEAAESFASRVVSLLEASEPTLSVMFKENPEQQIWEKALKKVIAKELNPRRVFGYRVAPKCYEFRYTRFSMNRPIARDLQTITDAIKSGSTLSFVYPGATSDELESTRFVRPLALELNESGQVYLRARRISAGKDVTRNYLATRGHSYVAQSTPKLSASWIMRLSRSGNLLTAELTPTA